MGAAYEGKIQKLLLVTRRQAAGETALGQPPHQSFSNQCADLPVGFLPERDDENTERSV
jgi:hypothetical protein